MATEAPTLPYVRDEAATSQPQSAYPVYPGEVYDHEGHLDAEEDEDEMENGGVAMQYWTAKRHKASRGKQPGDDEYSGF